MNKCEHGSFDVGYCVSCLRLVLQGAENSIAAHIEHEARLRAELGEIQREAYRRGAEAMREAAAVGLDRLLTRKKATAIWVAPNEIRELPVPEDK